MKTTTHLAARAFPDLRRLALTVCFSGFALGLDVAGADDKSAAAPDAGATAFHFRGPGKVSPEIVSILEQCGGRVHWGPNNLLAYDKQDLLHRFQVWVMDPAGASPRWLQYTNPALLKCDAGNPAWHPSGNYVVVQAVDREAPAWAAVAPVGPTLYKRLTSPGFGFNSNLWIIAVDGTRAAPLTQLPAGKAVLHPRFSHKGDRLLWSEMTSLQPQKWVMRVGTFRYDNDGPHLTDIKTLDPVPGNAFYEADDFSADDKSVLFSTTRAENDYWHMNLARVDLATGQVRALTEPGAAEWNEYAHESPDGTRIVWMSTAGIEQYGGAKSAFTEKSDYWTMNADGTGRKRLTYFNEPGAPEYRPALVAALDSSWSPDGKALMAYVQLRIPGETPDVFPGSIVRVTVP